MPRQQNKCLETSVAADSPSRPVVVSVDVDAPSSSSSAAAAANVPSAGGGGGPGVHDQRLMLISVCVMSAVLTGVTVFALVHCRHAASRATAACSWRLRSGQARPPEYCATPSARSPSGMSQTPPATPLHCLCCEMTFGGSGKQGGKPRVSTRPNPDPSPPPIINQGESATVMHLTACFAVGGLDGLIHKRRAGGLGEEARQAPIRGLTRAQRERGRKGACTAQRPFTSRA